MKLKKLLSSFAALSMIVAVMAVPTFAEGEATVTTKIVELTDDVITEADKSDFTATYGYGIDELESHARVYKVESTVTGLGAEITIESGRGGSKVYSGTVVNVASISFKFPATAVYSDSYGDVLPAKSASDSNELGMSGNGIKGALTFATDAVADAKVMHPYAEALTSGENETFDSFTVKGYIVANTNDFEVEVELVSDIASITNSAMGGLYKTYSNGNANIIYSPSNPIDVDAAPIVPDEPEKITPKNEVVPGDFGGKTLKLIAEVLDSVDATKKVRINKLDSEGNVAESRESGRTLAQIVNGVSVSGNSITGKLAVGVLTTDADAVFTFELYE